MSDRPKAASAWAPLGQSLFRSLWIASVVSNIGAWMEDVGEAWLMTSQTPSPLLVALLQTAESPPIFLLALPAGAFRWNTASVPKTQSSLSPPWQPWRLSAAATAPIV